MILVDFNQVAISNLMAYPMGDLKQGIEEDFVRHMILNTLRSCRQKFTEEYGEIVICCDHRNYWRREIFPYYKANRKKDRLSSGIDWNAIFTFLNKIRKEIKENFPYKVMLADGAEADDIIGTICHKYGTISPIDGQEKILILSGDKDFIQLQKYTNVYQYDPIRKKKINGINPFVYVEEHIMKGDRGDGIPNFLSSDDCIVLGTRQKPLTSIKLETYKNMSKDELPGELSRNYKRNQQLINLDYIPKQLQDNIIIHFEDMACNGRDKLLNYFIKNKLRNLTEHIGEF